MNKFKVGDRVVRRPIGMTRNANWNGTVICVSDTSIRVRFDFAELILWWGDLDRFDKIEEKIECLME